MQDGKTTPKFVVVAYDYDGHEEYWTGYSSFKKAERDYKIDKKHFPTVLLCKVLK